MSQKILFVLEENSDTTQTLFCHHLQFFSLPYIWVSGEWDIRMDPAHTLLHCFSGSSLTDLGWHFSVLAAQPYGIVCIKEKIIVSFYTFSTSDPEQELKCWDLFLPICRASKSVTGHLILMRKEPICLFQNVPQHPREGQPRNGANSLANGG